MEEREAKVKKHFLLTEIVITYHGKVKFLVHMCVYTSTRLLIIGLFHACLKSSNHYMTSLVLSIIQC